MKSSLPSDDDEKIKEIPSVGEISSIPKQPHGCHLHQHLHQKESEKEMLKLLQDLTSCVLTTRILWIVKSQHDAIQNNNKDDDTLKPPVSEVKKDGCHYCH